MSEVNISVNDQQKIFKVIDRLYERKWETDEKVRQSLLFEVNQLG